MKKSWKDPDTGLVHVIDREEDRSSAWEHAHEMPGLIELPLEEIAKRFLRRVHTSCGIMMRLDSDEFIMSQGGSPLSARPLILRPWLTGRDAPTCVVCAAAKPAESMCNDGGSRLRGA